MLHRMLFGSVLLVGALVVVSAAMEKNVVMRAEAAASACTAPGGAPHPCDPQLLVLCAGEHVPLTVVHCPPGTRASNQTKGCQTIDGDDALLQGGLANDRPARRRLRREDVASPLAGSTTFTCRQAGPFPDPDDCRRYHVCNEKLQHFTDTCNTEYDPGKAECIDVGPPCTRVPLPMKCSQENYASKAFATDPSFYLLCLQQPTEGFKIAVMHCPDEQVFDDTTAKCVYKCKDNYIRYPDPMDCHSFYECSGPGTENKAVKKICSEGLAYDSGKRMCVLEERVKSCSPATTSPPPPSTSTSPTTSSGDCLLEGPVANPRRCNEYFICCRSRDRLMKITMTCPPLTSFRTKHRKCVFDLFCGFLDL